MGKADVYKCKIVNTFSLGRADPRRGFPASQRGLYQAAKMEWIDSDPEGLLAQKHQKWNLRLPEYDLYRLK
jgi:hypothetical protein